MARGRIVWAHCPACQSLVEAQYDEDEYDMYCPSPRCLDCGRYTVREGMDEYDEDGNLIEEDE